MGPTLHFCFPYGESLDHSLDPKGALARIALGHFHVRLTDDHSQLTSPGQHAGGAMLAMLRASIHDERIVDQGLNHIPQADPLSVHQYRKY